MVSVAQLYMAHEQYEKAEVLYKRAIPILTKRYGADDPKVANQIAELGFILTQEQKYDEAEPLFKQAIQ